MLSPDDRSTLMKIAREAIEAAASDRPRPALDLESLSPALRESRATFVTLNIDDDLRGCIGGLYANMPLAFDVQEHAIGAALYDPRFPPVSADEVHKVHIEISVLTPPETITFHSPNELLSLLRPNVDGVILTSGWRRATFLPQVWEKVSDPVRFLEMLSEKMGAPSEQWCMPDTEVMRYQVEVFAEPRTKDA